MRLMFTGTYRYSPPQAIDPSQIQRRILPPETPELATLPVEKAAYIPHKLDFHVAPNALTVQPQAQPSIAHIVPRQKKLKTATGRRAPDAKVTAALTHPVAQPTSKAMPHGRETVSTIAATEAALDETRLARERRYALLVVNRDIAVATEFARRFVLHTPARPVAGPQLGALTAESPSGGIEGRRDLNPRVAALTNELIVQPGLLELPETLAPSDHADEMTSKPNAPTSVDDVSKAGTVAPPTANPKRSLIAAKPKRRKSRHSSRRAPRTKRPRPTPVAPSVFGGADYGPKWAQSFLSAN